MVRINPPMKSSLRKDSVYNPTLKSSYREDKPPSSQIIFLSMRDLVTPNVMFSLRDGNYNPPPSRTIFLARRYSIHQMSCFSHTIRRD